jgi:hypothetical protein
MLIRDAVPVVAKEDILLAALFSETSGRFNEFHM